LIFTEFFGEYENNMKFPKYLILILMMSILICLKAGTLSLNDQEFLIFFCNSLVQQANDNLFGSATFRYNKMIPTLGGRREN